MLKIERKLLLWVEKHMFLLMALLAAGIALYLRRSAIWWANVVFPRDEMAPRT